MTFSFFLFIFEGDAWAEFFFAGFVGRVDIFANKKYISMSKYSGKIRILKTKQNMTKFQAPCGN